MRESETKRNTFIGTPYWMAPEVIRRSPGGDHPAADVWSVGCTVIEMASGKHPWGDCSGQVQAIFKIASTKELPKVPQSLSPHASEFVLMCLQRDPAARPNSEALLQHPFILGAGDVDVPALQYEGYWSDGYDGDGLGGFDGGSEHGGGISGFTTTDSDANEVDHGVGVHRVRGLLPRTLPYRAKNLTRRASSLASTSGRSSRSASSLRTRASDVASEEHSTSAPVSFEASLHEAVHDDGGKDASSAEEGALNDAFLYAAWPMSAFALDAHVS